MPKVIPKFYTGGLNDFNAGKSVLNVAETMNAFTLQTEGIPYTEERESQMFSYMIGFMDGILKKVRSFR